MIGFKLTDVTPDYIRECFTYDDGKLYWKVRPDSHITECAKVSQNNKLYAGKQAGYFCKRTDSKRPDFGYWLCRLNCGLFKIHRIIFYMHHGYLPKIIDHIDGDTNNNRIENLREADSKGNSANSKKATGSYLSVYKGVTSSKSRPDTFRAFINQVSANTFLGNYKSEDEAASAYDVAAICEYGDFAKLNNSGFPITEIRNINKNVNKYLKEYNALSSNGVSN